ncbi:MAG: IPTL-CTERM sorting domain-containing protein [Xanthomonadales bacterium]|jgi:hypothetical protein|nr:IPTL-CTERM sorting domain-containing protein [Xanthomonadales bacterium]
MNISSFRAKVSASLLLALFASPAWATESITNVAVDDATPVPGQTLQVTVDATLSASNDDWQSTQIELSGVVGTAVCINDPDIINTGGSFQEVFSYTLAASLPDSSYDVLVSGWKENGCTNDFDGTATGTAAITVVAEADLAVSVTENNSDPAVAGQDSLDYAFSIDNLGPNDATLVVATFNAGSSGTITTSGCVYTPSQGTFSWPTWTVGTITAAQAPVTISEVCPIGADSEDGANRALMLTVTSLDQVDPVSGNDFAEEDTTIERQFDLALSVLDAPDPVLAGSGTDNLTHTFTLSRSGPSDAAGVAVDIVPTLPAGVTPVSFTPSVGAMNGLVWEVGDWAATENGTDQTLVISLTVDATATDCTDCVSAEGTVSATSGTDTEPTNDVAVDPTSIETAAAGASGFETSIVFTNGNEGMVDVTLVCNSGLPLEQTTQISAASGVTFSITDLDFVDPGTNCTVSLSGLDNGYAAAVLANGEDTGEACAFSGTPVVDESAAFATDRANTCVITATPLPTTVMVETDVVGVEDPNIDTGFVTTISCDNVSPDTGPSFGTVSVDDTTGVFAADWYVEPGETSDCTVTMVPDSSVVEGDSCTFSFVLGDAEAGCDVTGTVFFEGIPTLSQYGLALMALLMLGVGFVGFRRFV